MAVSEQHHEEAERDHYFVDVDGVEIGFDHEPVSGAEIMDEKRSFRGDVFNPASAQPTVASSRVCCQA